MRSLVRVAATMLLLRAGTTALPYIQELPTMATTTWIGGSGNWNTGSNWTDGVPTAPDAAVFTDSSGPYTVSGGGTAATITITGDASSAATLTLAGTYTANTFDAILTGVHLTGATSLAFGTGAVSGGTLTLNAGATLGSGPLNLYQASLAGTIGTLSNPLDLLTGTRLPDPGFSGTLTGPITGPGGLELGVVLNQGIILGSQGGSLTFAGPGNSFPNGISLEGGRLEIAAPSAAGTNPILMFGGTLVLDAGVSVGPILANLAYAAVTSCAISAASGNETVFAGIAPTTFSNGSGSSEVIGTEDPGWDPAHAFLADFGQMTVTGGTGSVTVFGANEGGSIFGGTGGGNVIVAGATILPGEQPFANSAHGAAQTTAKAATIGGGGDGDLLVATGTVDNVIAAATGNETLTGSGATGDNVFFGGSGADLIVAGGGRDLVVGGSGAQTLMGGTGATAIFAGGGADVIVGGAGADYLQVGSGKAAIFTGAGADLIAFVDGQAGGAVTVSGFRPGIDHIAARGYAAAPTSAVVAGSTVLTFSDHTQATLLGLTGLSGSSFA